MNMKHVNTSLSNCLRKCISPSLLMQINELHIDKPVPPELHTGWEELLGGSNNELPEPNSGIETILARYYSQHPSCLKG